MSFLAPVMLWGLLAAGVPIALHFFYRSRYRRVPWAAMRFLRISIEQTRRRVRFQELLLLLVRVALLVLFVLALARPSGSGLRGSSLGEPVDAVLIVDTSCSMDAREGAVTRLARAKAAARAAIDHLPPRSTVQIIACADRARVVSSGAPSDLERARQAIESLEISHLATDLLPGVSTAVEALQRGRLANQELYLFSDMQKSGWDAQASPLTAKLREISRQATVCLVRCGTRMPRNVAVVGIIPQGGIPHVGERAAFAVLVRNTGREPVQNLMVTLTVDGQQIQQEAQPIEVLAPGETRTVALTAKLDQPGVRVLTATVKPDELEADNRLDRVIQVRERMRILVVDGAPNTKEPEKDSSYYLMHGLLPVRDTDKERYPVQPRVVTPRQATPNQLDEQDLCILVNVALPGSERERGEALSPEFAGRLSAFVRVGHGLMIFSGDRVSAEAYNRILYQDHGLLPASIAIAPAAQPVQLDRRSAAGPSFAVFRSREEYQALQGIEIRRYLHVEVAPEATQVVLRYTDGQPALLTRKVGAGEVLLVTTSADLTWTDWPLWKGMYVPFLDLAVNHLLQGQTQPYNVTAGEPLHWQPPERYAARSFAVVDPAGRRVRLNPPETVQGRPVVTANNTMQAGVYRMGLAEDASEAGVPFAVVPDLRETENLDTLSDEQLDERLGFQPVHRTAGDESTAVYGVERLHQEWGLWLLAGALLLAVGEPVLAWLNDGQRFGGVR
jgi:hypothetical protein